MENPAYCGRGHPWSVVLGSKRKQTEQGMMSKSVSSTPPGPLYQPLPPGHGPAWVPVLPFFGDEQRCGRGRQINPFLHTCCGHCLHHSNTNWDTMLLLCNITQLLCKLTNAGVRGLQRQRYGDIMRDRKDTRAWQQALQPGTNAHSAARAAFLPTPRVVGTSGCPVSHEDIWIKVALRSEETPKESGRERQWRDGVKWEDLDRLYWRKLKKVFFVCFFYSRNWISLFKDRKLLNTTLLARTHYFRRLRM